MGIVKFGTRFKSRPVKSAGKKRQRVKAQKKRLLTAGMDEKSISKLGVKATRDAVKKLKV